MSFGISAALLTPFDAAGRLDTGRLTAHAGRLLARGLDGVTPFGTTGEGASVTAAERMDALDAFAAAGLPMARVTLGITACAVADALGQAHAARERGVTTLLVAPPFYYPDPGTDGVHDWYAALLSGLPESTSVVLYHIPGVTGVALSPDLVGRLHGAFPGRVRAIKDSSGDRAGAFGLLALGGPEVLIGDERLLAEAAANGAAGAITGMANFHPERLLRVLGTRLPDVALDAEVDAIVAHPIVPALKALMGERNPAWRAVRPPLVTLAENARATLLGRVAANGTASPAGAAS